MGESRADYVASPEDAFLRNVAAVPYPVKVAEDLFDEDGDLVLGSGAVVDEATARVLARSGLASQVRLHIPYRVDREFLFEALLKLPDRHSDLGAIAEQYPSRDIISKALNRVQLDESVVDVLSVYRHRLPMMFEETLFAVWIASILIEILDLPRVERDSAFLGTLLRDTGHLFVAPDVLDRLEGGELSRAERSRVREHPRLGAELVGSLPGLTEHTREVILWHHARVDGSGYPPRPVDNILPFYVQLVGFVDSVVRARMQSAEGITLFRARKIFVLNLEFFDGGILGAYLHMLGDVEESVEEPDESLRVDLVEAILERARRLEDDFRTLEEQISSGTLKRKLPKGSPLLEKAKKLSRVMLQSGHGSSELTWWLKALRAGQDDIAWEELLDIDIQQRELQNEFTRLTQAVEEVAPWSRKDILGPDYV